MQHPTNDMGQAIKRAETFAENTGQRHIAFLDPELGGFLAVSHDAYQTGKYSWVNPLWVCFDTADPHVKEGYTERLPILEY